MAHLSLDTGEETTISFFSDFPLRTPTIFFSITSLIAWSQYLGRYVLGMIFAASRTKSANSPLCSERWLERFFCRVVEKDLEFTGLAPSSFSQ